MSTPTNASGLPGTGRRLALVVGVNRAPNASLSSLNYAIADAEAMAEVLQEHCSFELLEPPLSGENAPSDRVKKAVLRLARNRGDDDFLLLYFSGHGHPMLIEAERRDVYLVTSDFDEVEVEEDENAHLSMRWLRDKLYIPTQAGRVLLILDCCYAGNIERSAPDPYLEDLLRRIKYYFGVPGAESGARSGGLRLALTATGHDAPAKEQDGHGLMTGLLLPALSRKRAQACDDAGLVSPELLYSYLKKEMPPDQQPSLEGGFAGRSCILASFPEIKKHGRPVANDRPRNYIPFPRNLQFQPRPGEFERLETVLFGPGTGPKPMRLGLVGVVGLGGVGKTQLAIELAYRFKDRFPAGVFWMPATGTTVFEWQRQLAELAASTDYLPPDDDPSNPEHEVRRARHFCRYLAAHKDALLILDNVEDPHLVISVLPALAGGDVACALLYTSRNQQALPSVVTHAVEELPEEAALRLLLETTRPALLAEILAGSQDEEACAARAICRGVGGLPLALVHLRGLLVRDTQVTVKRLADVLKKRGALELAKTQQGDAAPLFATFCLSWEKVRDEGARRLFKLASFFPEAAPIPLWLLGLAAGLGESADILEPLWEARMQLQELSLLEALSGEQVRLHPLVREFGRRLVAEDGEQGKALLAEAAEAITAECTNVNRLEYRGQRKGYWNCLEDVRAARDYVELLGANQAEQLSQIGRWLDCESYLLGDEHWWPNLLPGLFYQQIYNRAVEEGQFLPERKVPWPWIRQIASVGAANNALIRTFAGHQDGIRSVAFSPDGTKILTGSLDGTAQLWEMGSGKPLRVFKGHQDGIRSVAFSSDGTKILSGSDDKTARLWEVESGETLMTFKGHQYQVLSVAFSPDGTKVLTGSVDGAACLWEVVSGNILVKFEGHQGWVSAIAFSADGTKILTGSDDKTARLWEAKSGKLLMTLKGHQKRVESVAFSLDETKVLTGSGDKTARLWEAASGKLLVRFKGHQN